MLPVEQLEGKALVSFARTIDVGTETVLGTQ
jgi:hypothetical protein